ncbi:hypothetical protein LTR08_000122 [Meristemomyces frigidus]|nr:hypothetical protein LTR08_000122 [Meristemomyces frigidus]
MPTATRRQAHAHERSRNQGTSDAAVDITSDGIPPQAQIVAAEPDHDMEDDGLDGVDDDEEDAADDEDDLSDPFPPPGLKEISSLASWTVSTAKPGNGVAALRSPDLAHFWQSDGPQPHLLSIHFFKLVPIVSIRLYLDFDNDESYTPTKIQFLAGMGVHDIQEFAEMSYDQATGWKEVDFSNVGPVEPDDDDDDSDDEKHKDVDWSKRPVLSAFLVQVRILENHQNGKDTHLRAVQLFAKDETQQSRDAVSIAKSIALPTRTHFAQKAKQAEANNIKLAPWMLEPDLR